MGTRGSFDYGIFAYRYRSYMAHRLSFLLFKGINPKENFVCHSCDNPRCVNPDHLWLGTAMENNRDTQIKNRTSRGERNSQAKLSSDQVRAIRAMRAKGVTESQTATHFGVSKITVSRVCRRIYWKHVA